MEPRTIGVEEEFLLVDSTNGQPRAIAAAVLRLDDAPPAQEMEAELQLQQIETGTQPCASIGQLYEEIRAARTRASDGARDMGAEIAALGTSPLPVKAELSPSDRFSRLAERFGLTAREQLTCGCHVHVAVTSDEEAIGVLDRIRPWLAPLLALSANSPFWQGEDSRYASFRSQVWSRWPSAGPTELFGSAKAYHDAVEDMVATRTVLDPAMVYFDARLAQRYPTVEIRVPDVCLHAEDAVLLAALVRGLVETAAREWAADVPAHPARLELLKLATWQAGRYGLGGQLLDPLTSLPTAADAVLTQLLGHVRESLEDSGDLGEVERMLRELLARGNGASLQQAARARSGNLCEVVADAVRRTRRS
jgi:carboxylate-amine ligase